MTQDNYEEKYTKPDLRRQIKDELMQSDKGGKPGQWSARKSQLLVQEYEKRGGGYKKDGKDAAAESLTAWSEQDWQTQDEDQACQDGKTKRYLPKEVWQRLSDAEKREAERIKQEASKKGEQYVKWTPAIKGAMVEAGYADADDGVTKQELYQQAQELDIEGRTKMNKEDLAEAVDDAGLGELQEQTYDELYQQAQELDIEGRSKMNKEDLAKAIHQNRD